MQTVNDSELQCSTTISKVVSHPSPRPQFRLWHLLLSIPIAAVMAFSIWQPIQVLPRMALAPGFGFVDQDGNRLTSDNMRGKFAFYTFSYTRCDAACPQTVQGLQSIEAAVSSLNMEGIPVAYIAVSIDPGYDTPDRLKSYMRQLDIDRPAWHFVTGDPDHLKQVIGNGFSAYYAAKSEDTFVVDPVYVLVDGWGIIRATYRTTNPDPVRIQRDVGLLVQEARNQAGVTRYAYEAAHLFLCYPRT